MRYTDNGAALGSRRRARVVYAVLASVLLHGAVITVWNLQSRHGRQVPPVPRQAMEVQWIGAVPEAPAPPAPQPSPRPELPLQARVPSKSSAATFRPSHRHEPGSGAVVQAPEPAGAAALEAASQGAPTQEMAAPAPQRPASDSRMTDAPLRWSPDAVGRADRQEREWQRRHDDVPAAQRAAGAGSAAAIPLGGVPAVREWRGGDGSRVTQVEGPAGTYCVRLPSANRLPDVGAAPRVAPVSNCP